MFDFTLAAIAQAYSGEVARRNIGAISQFHRIQASPGYREAARYVQTQLDMAGLCTEVLSFPANEDATYWTMEGFQEWACAKATLDVVRDGQVSQRLCDYHATPISLIQRSASTEGIYEVVVLEDGTEDSHYDGIDVTGKLVLTDGELSRVYDLAVRRRGAAGILFDGMSQTAPGRSPMDLPDARQYTSFWWGKGDPRCFGFVVTPRQGRYLRNEAPLQVRAHIVSTLYDGAYEVVTALIPGETEEEVLVVSHLCHPQPSANDNASGAAANIEIAVVLRRLISEGTLPPPKRSIRFLWMPEMTGTYAYLSTYEARLPRVVAGLNLDMVGQDQARCHSTFTIEQPPEAMASFAPVLLKQLWDRAASMPTTNGPFPETPANEPATLRHAVSPFSGGSDHYILSDPTVGIPTPMLIQWPDRFYHTSEDTPDKVDPVMLARIGSLAAAYAYVVATAGEREATWLGHEIVTRRQQRLARRAQDTITAALESNDVTDLGRSWYELRKAVAHRIDCDEMALQSLLRLWPGARRLIAELRQSLDQAAAQALIRAEAVCLSRATALGGQLVPTPDQQDASWRSRARLVVPERRYRGPLAFRSLLDGESTADRDLLWKMQRENGRAWWTARALAEYWADGNRTVAQIADRVEQETGASYGPQILTYFELLAAKGAVTLHEQTPTKQGDRA